MIISILLLLYLSVASVMDLMWRRVKNTWIIFGIFSGFYFSIFDAGIWGDGGCQLDLGSPGLILSLLGFFLPLPLIILYQLRLIGAGDIKLLMVSGIYLGPRNLIECLPFMLITATIISLIVLILHADTVFKKLHHIPLAPAIMAGVLVNIII